MAALAYAVPEVPFQNPRALRVACIGAGFSGLYLTLRIQQRCENVEFVVYEKNKDIGGTWLENTYPGAACDVPSHIYCYTFEPYTGWSDHYARSSEILAYLRQCADKFKARPFIRFQHKLVSAIWDDNAGKWDLEVECEGRVIKDKVDVLVNGCGFLNNWKWPKIPGMEQYRGKLMHTAAWDSAYDYTNKRVAVIGSGSSALQVIPTMQPQVKHLDAYIRSPTYIPPPIAADYLEEHHSPDYAGDRKYTPLDKKRFENDPKYWLAYRKDLESGFNRIFESFTINTDQNRALHQAAVNHMKARLADRPDLLEHLVPKWEVGCRRLSPAIGFLESLIAKNTTVIKEEIECLTETGVKTCKGEEREVDVIVCATGFDVSFKPRFVLRGKGGFELGHAWAAEPRSYITVAIENMPNYFIFNGPYCCTGNGSLVPCIEAEGDYIVRCINKIQRQNIKSMTPKLKAIQEFSIHADTFLKRSAWAGACRSWYKTGSGRVVGVWPGTSLPFIELMRDPRWEDYEYENLDFGLDLANRWSFLGNGYTVAHATGATDLAPYLDDPVPALL